MPRAKKKPTDMEQQFLRRTRLLSSVCIAVAVGFIPGAVLLNRLLPSIVVVGVFSYLLLMSALILYVSTVRCPRCGEYFNFRHPFKSFDSYSPRPLGHCQNLECDLKLHR